LLTFHWLHIRYGKSTQQEPDLQGKTFIYWAFIVAIIGRIET